MAGGDELLEGKSQQEEPELSVGTPEVPHGL